MAQNEGDPEHEHEPPIEILEPELNEEFQNNDNEHDEFHCQEDLFDENEEIKEEDLNVFNYLIYISIKSVLF